MQLYNLNLLLPTFRHLYKLFQNATDVIHILNQILKLKKIFIDLQNLFVS